jgi:hypothetical protein
VQTVIEVIAELGLVISPRIGEWPIPDAAKGGFSRRQNLRRGIQSTTEVFRALIHHRQVPRAQANNPDYQSTPERWRKEESAAAMSCLRVAVH